MSIFTNFFPCFTGIECFELPFSTGYNFFALRETCLKVLIWGALKNQRDANLPDLLRSNMIGSLTPSILQSSRSSLRTHRHSFSWSLKTLSGERAVQ